MQATNYMFEGLKSKGLIIFDFSKDFNINNSKILIELSDKEKTHNRNVLKKLLGNEATLNYTRELVSNIFK